MRTVALLTCLLLSAGCSVEADFSDVLQVEILDADQYQQEIAAIDRLLFSEEPLGEEGVAAAEKAIGDLARRVGAHSDSKFIKLETMELKLLAANAQRLSPRGNGARLREPWMRIRNNLFEDRHWFARSAADLEYAASVIPPPGQQPKPLPSANDAKEARTWGAEVPMSGTWRVVSMTAGGAPREDAELTGSLWTFDLPRLTIRPSGGKETSYNFSPRDRSLAVMLPDGSEGSILYEVDAEGLRLAFFDGLKGEPKGFTAGGGDPLLVVLRLVRTP